MDNAGPVMFVALLALCAGLALPGYWIGIAVQERRDREKFIIYCTGKGDTFQGCDEIWYGKRPSPPPPQGSE